MQTKEREGLACPHLERCRIESVAVPLEEEGCGVPFSGERVVPIEAGWGMKTIHCGTRGGGLDNLCVRWVSARR